MANETIIPGWTRMELARLYGCLWQRYFAMGPEVTEERVVIKEALVRLRS